ncbi:hypothetical protein [Streptomyces sp. NPDC088350]|uniref:hypothetical protein n=1 Tax=Streptomyces sp. NPDC088350 TaxID=3365854 RepID=UPI003803E1B3
MDVFRAHEQLIEDYDEFTRSLVWVRDPAIRAHLKEERDCKTRWPDPWISLNPMFRKGGTVAELTEPRDGEPPVLAPLCAQYFRDKRAAEDVDGPLLGPGRTYRRSSGGRAPVVAGDGVAVRLADGLA